MNLDNVTASDPFIIELAATVQRLAQRVESLEKVQRTAEERASASSISTATQAVEAATEALFAREVTLEETHDPEIDERYYIVRVSATGNPESMAERYREWHRKLGDWAPGLEWQFRLALEFKNEDAHDVLKLPIGAP